MALKNNILVNFLLVLAIQVVLSGLVDFGPLLNICIYPLFIITLPINIKANRLLLWAFAMGLATDYFTNSIMGLNSASAVFMAAAQPYLFGIISRKGDLENQIRPGLAQLGLVRFTNYLLISLLIHHTVLSFIESFGLANFLYNLPRMLVSLAANSLLIILTEYGIFYKNWQMRK